MKYFLVLLLFVCKINSQLHAQSSIDTLPLQAIQKMTKLDDLYKLPGEKDSLDHFVAFISLPGIEPVAAYNRGKDFEPNTIENLNQLTPGSKLSILAYAINSDHPELGPLKLPRKDFYIK